MFGDEGKADEPISGATQLDGGVGAGNPQVAQLGELESTIADAERLAKGDSFERSVALSCVRRARIDAATLLVSRDAGVGKNADTVKTKEALETRLEKLDASLAGVDEPSDLEQFRASCEAEDTLCLLADGSLPVFETHSVILDRGQTLDVMVLGKAADEGDAYEVKLAEQRHVFQLQVGEDTDGKPEAAESGKCDDPDALRTRVLHRATLDVPDKAGVVRAVVRYTRSKAGAGDGKGILATSSYRFWINQGRAFVDFGLMVPFVPHGKRAVVGNAVPGAELRTLDERSTLLVVPALVANIYPAGRRRGRFGAFDSGECTGNERHKCRARNVAEMLGLQLGADLDIRDPLDQFYFGGLVEFVTGVGFSFGAAVLKLDRVRPDLQRGQVVVSDGDLKPEQYYGVRFYAGFTISFGLARLASAARATAAALRP